MRTYLIAFKSGRFETLQCEWASMRDQFAAFAINGFPYFWIDRDILNAIREVTGHSPEQINAIKRTLRQPMRSAEFAAPPPPESDDDLGAIPQALLIDSDGGDA